MRRYTIQLLLVSLSWFWLTTSCTHREARFRIGVSQCSDDEWRHQMNNEMLREALFYDGVEIDIRTVKDDNAEQIKDIRNFIKEGVDLLVVAPNEAAPITPVVEEAFDRGIPVIVFDRKILSDKYTAYIGADNYELGKAIGNYVANMLHGQGNVVEIAGLTGSTPAMDRHQGFVAAISPYPGIQLLAREDAGWLRSEAGEKMDTLLARFPEIDVVYAQNDRMAAGAYDVAERQGRAEEMRFIGTDALPGEGYGVEQVLNGQLDATFIYPTGGDRVIQMAMDILNKRDFPRETILSTSVVDATNAQIMQMQTSHIATLDEKIETMNGKMSQFLDRYATQQVILYGSLLVLLLVIGLLVAVYLSLRTKNRLNRELSRQKEKLEEQKQQLTQQKELLIQQKEQLEQLSRELEEATHAKLVFFTNVSHDFRTPLTLIADPINQLLADKSLGEHPHQLLELMKKNANILLRLVNQILDFRKVESGNMKLSLSQGDIIPFVSDVCSVNFAPLMKKKKQTFVFSVEEETLIACFDADKVDKIVSNLLSNACKHTDAGGEIKLMMKSYQVSGHRRLCIQVSDTGEGIASEELENIFARFYTAHKKDGSESNGIGLSLTKDLVELHHGSIKVESELGKGSIFTVDFPIDKDSYKENEFAVEKVKEKKDEVILGGVDLDESEETEMGTHQTNEHHLLLVEDNEDLLYLMKRILSRNYHVLIAKNGIEALEIVKENEIDIVISDVMMPEMDGLELCRNLKSDLETSHIPVILLTAKNTVEDRVECYNAGADGYIAKPFELKILEARINNFINHKRSKQEEFRSNADAQIDALETSVVDKEFFDKVVSVIETNISEGDFGVVQLADALAVSKSSLYRKMKVATGLSPIEFIRNIRLKHGSQLLKNRSISVAEVAYECGFSNPKYFAICFKDEFGVTPKEYQKTLK